jgi:hypothetical protein
MLTKELQPAKPCNFGTLPSRDLSMRLKNDRVHLLNFC